MEGVVRSADCSDVYVEGTLSVLIIDQHALRIDYSDKRQGKNVEFDWVRQCFKNASSNVYLCLLISFIFKTLKIWKIKIKTETVSTFFYIKSSKKSD